MDPQAGPILAPELAARIHFVQVTAPLPNELAWEVESLLLKIFEYGDYSFRSALAGRYSETLDCTFVLAKCDGILIGAAGCLHSRADPAIAILGPVGVAPEYRRNGIGARLVQLVADYLATRHCTAIYLAVSPGNPAARLYEAAGFKPYRGIVMRWLPFGECQSQSPCFGEDSNIMIRPVAWGDFPAVQALAVWPCQMYTFDLQRGIFSSRYCEPTRFLSVFPDMMRTFARTGGGANVLLAGERQHVVGIAWIRRLPAEAQHHVAEFDLFVHDDFIAKAVALGEATIQRRVPASVGQINCGCLSCDEVKRQILEQLGARHVATLPGQARIKGEYVDVLVYRIS